MTGISAESLLGLNFCFCDGGLTSCAGNTGKIWRQTISVGGQQRAVQEYRHDSLNRLTYAAENSSTGTCPDANSAWCQHYTYDAAGNRTVDQEYGAAVTTWDTNTFNAATNRISAATWKYDDAGRLTKDYQGETIAYDAENHQIAFCRAAGDTCANPTQSGPQRTLYVYNGEGRRVQRMDVDGSNSVTSTVFVYDVTGRLAAEYSSLGSSLSGTQYLVGDRRSGPSTICRRGAVGGKGSRVTGRTR